MMMCLFENYVMNKCSFVVQTGLKVVVGVVKLIVKSVELWAEIWVGVGLFFVVKIEDLIYYFVSEGYWFGQTE